MIYSSFSKSQLMISNYDLYVTFPTFFAIDFTSIGTGGLLFPLRIVSTRIPLEASKIQTFLSKEVVIII